MLLIVCSTTETVTSLIFIISIIFVRKKHIFGVREKKYFASVAASAVSKISIIIFTTYLIVKKRAFE